MASTEASDCAQILALDPARDLPSALLLSRSASWNQNEADWRTMLTLGRGWGIRAADANGVEQLAASIVVLPYGSEFAWVSMVLVLPRFRRQGYASLLLRHALADLRGRKMGGILDATPEGHLVYIEEGFEDTWGFRRYRREANPLPGAAPMARAPEAAAPEAAAPDAAARDAARPAAVAPQPHGEPIASRPLRESDWPAILAIDKQAFGGDRETLLRALAARLPEAALVAESGRQLRGFVFARDGREANQMGPLVTDDLTLARSLLDEALRRIDGPVYIDLVDRHQSLLPWLACRGFLLQRPFTRMVHGLPQAPGNLASVVLVAGPELG